MPMLKRTKTLGTLRDEAPGFVQCLSGKHCSRYRFHLVTLTRSLHCIAWFVERLAGLHRRRITITHNALFLLQLLQVGIVVAVG